MSGTLNPIYFILKHTALVEWRYLRLLAGRAASAAVRAANTRLRTREDEDEVITVMCICGVRNGRVCD